MKKLFVSLIVLASFNTKADPHYSQAIFDVSCTIKGSVGSLKQEEYDLPNELKFNIRHKEIYKIKNKFLSKKKVFKVVKKETEMFNSEIDEILELNSVKTKYRYEHHNNYSNGFRVTNTFVKFNFKKLSENKLKELFIRLGSDPTDVSIIKHSPKLNAYINKEAYNSSIHGERPKGWGFVKESFRYDLGVKDGIYFNLYIHCAGEN